MTVLGWKYWKKLIALADRGVSAFQYFHSSTVIYLSNLKVFLSKSSAKRAPQILTDKNIFWVPFDFMAEYLLYAVVWPTGGPHRAECVKNNHSE